MFFTLFIKVKQLMLKLVYDFISNFQKKKLIL